MLYKFIWIAFAPLVYGYFFWKSYGEISYRKNFLERLGWGPSFHIRSIWIHAVSLGELRAAVPLIHELLARSEKLLITTITPAGREEAFRIFKQQVHAKKILIIYLPLEYNFAFSRFFKRYKPKLGLVLEYELWPVMIKASKSHKVPLVLAQAQYVEKSFIRDQKWPRVRVAFLDQFNLILAKSARHAERFKFLCNAPCEIMGELRFEQPILANHIVRAKSLSKFLNLKSEKRVSFCFGSTGKGEDENLIAVMRQLKNRAYELGLSKPFFIYVPRHRNEFLRIRELIDDSGLKFMSRSEILTQSLGLKKRYKKDLLNLDGVLGDSLGEINFYFQLSDYVFIGNSFNGLGAHNIIEPIALKRLVVVGPSTWGIEYPFNEAREFGIVTQVQSFGELVDFWSEKLKNKNITKQEKYKMMRFHNQHSGAAKNCILKLQKYNLLQ